MSTFRWPGASHQLTIIGRNGSGKSRMGAWILANSALTARPWVIFDYKGEELFSRLGDRVQELKLSGRVPRRPGLYIVRPRHDEQGAVEDFLWKIWERGNIGIMIDEGYMIPKESAFDTILTQGRSLKIPRIILTQRPSWLSRFVFSEANFYCVFHLNDKRDRQIVNQFLPNEIAYERLPPYNSMWYDVDHNANFILLPCPNDDTIIATLRSRVPVPWYRS